MAGEITADATYSIGSLAKIANTKVQTIRYYEQIGLIPAVHRTQGNQRFYGASHRDRLSFIRHARELGFPLESIRELLAISDDPDRSCAMVDQIAQEQLDAVKSRIARLRTLQAELERMIEQCGSGKVRNCHIIEVLADHSHAKCVSGQHDAVTDVAPTARKRGSRQRAS